MLRARDDYGVACGKGYQKIAKWLWKVYLNRAVSNVACQR